MEAEEERQVLARDAALVEREDEGPARGVHDVVGVLDALGDALVGEQLAQPVAGDEGRELLVGDFGVDGHGVSGAFRAAGVRSVVAARSSRGTLKAMLSRAVVTVSSVTSKRSRKASMTSSTSCSGAEAPAVTPTVATPIDHGPGDVGRALDEERVGAAGALGDLDEAQRVGTLRAPTTSSQSSSARSP